MTTPLGAEQLDPREPDKVAWSSVAAGCLIGFVLGCMTVAGFVWLVSHVVFTVR